MKVAERIRVLTDKMELFLTKAEYRHVLAAFMVAQSCGLKATAKTKEQEKQFRNEIERAVTVYLGTMDKLVIETEGK